MLLDDSIDVDGLPTSAGSIALQGSMPTADAKIVAKLKAAGAIILGKTNVTELNGVFDANMPDGYSSLGGQVLVPSDTDPGPGGSSGGSAAATASGMAAMTVGMETSTDAAAASVGGAQMITPAGTNGVVALKPTVGLVSRAGVLPVAKSQDSIGPIARTVRDAATLLQATAGPDPADPATVGTPAVPNYTAGLTNSALSGKRVAVISSTTAPYPAVVSALQAAGATTVVKTVGTPSPNPASIVTTEFKRDLNSYLSGIPGPGAKSLQEIIDYNNANPVEGLKYQQGELTAAQAVDLSDRPTAATYATNLSTGKASNQALIDTILNNGTPGDTSDDFDVVVVPSGNALVGIADRAGYPVLTVPAGFSTTSRDPIGVNVRRHARSARRRCSPTATRSSRRTNVRATGGPPSVTNPSMWRCVPYSTFFTAEFCHPGDLQSANRCRPDRVPGRDIGRRHGRADDGALAGVAGHQPGRVHRGHRGGLHVERDGVADHDGGRRDVVGARSEPDRAGAPRQRGVLAGVAAAGEGVDGHQPRLAVRAAGCEHARAAGLHEPGVARRDHDRLQAADLGHRAAAHRQLLEDPVVHSINHDAVAGLPTRTGRGSRRPVRGGGTQPSNRLHPPTAPTHP